MNIAYLLTGGNLGNRQQNLLKAKGLIEEMAGNVQSASSLYETAAWGPIAQPDYLNQVLCISTPLEPLELLKVLLDIEIKMGRERETRYAARTIDIDILFFNDDIIDSEELVIPHPRLYTRKFVLIPICEISPDLKHPILQLPMKALLKNCTDPLNVKKFIPLDASD